MPPEAFKEAMQILRGQSPFRPYIIEFTSGSQIEVRHPEAVILHDEILIYRNGKGGYSLFEYESVCRFFLGQQNQGIVMSQMSRRIQL